MENVSLTQNIFGPTLQLVLDAMLDSVFVITDDYKIIYGNQQMVQCAMARGIDDYSRYPCYQVTLGRDTPCDDCPNWEVFSNSEPVYRELYDKRFDAWFSVIELAIEIPDVHKRTKLVVARDITPWKKAEERIRALSHSLLRAQEAERNRLSRELHDDLGQQLNAIKLGLGMITEDLSSEEKDLRDRAKRLDEVLRTSIVSLRELASGLRPSALERRGLVRAIRTHCDDFSSSYGLAINFEATGMENLQLDDTLAINLFRIVQESLHNVIKHADASMVNIQLSTSFPFVSLVIEDDGKGFYPRKFLEGGRDDKHLGLVGMAERVDLLGGTFDIVSAPGEGTKIKVEAKFL